MVRSLPLLRQCAPVAALLRTMGGGYCGLISWWNAMADGVVTREERRRIWAAILAVELMAATVFREAYRIIMAPLDGWRR